MRMISRAVALAVSTTAFTAFLSPAADASHSASLKVCVFGAGGRDVDVEIDREGRGGFRGAEADPCVTFYGLRRGTYEIEIDPPRRYWTRDDDRRVYLSSGERERVTFYVHRNHHDGWDDDDDGWRWRDRDRDRDRDDDDDDNRLCPPGQRPVFDNDPNTPLCQNI